VKAIPGLSARLRPESALVPTTLGVKLDRPTALEIIVPLTARGPLRIQRDAERVLDVNAEHARDVRGLIESGAMVFVAPSTELDSILVAEPARITELRVFRGPPASAARFRLRLGDGLAGARIVGNVVELVTSSGAVWLRSDPLAAIDASGLHHAVTPALEGEGRTPTLILTVESANAHYPLAVAIGWSEGAETR
jgi:hypothetical protein